jgi:hypothetical protein
MHTLILLLHNCYQSVCIKVAASLNTLWFVKFKHKVMFHEMSII